MNTETLIKIGKYLGYRELSKDEGFNWIGSTNPLTKTEERYKKLFDRGLIPILKMDVEELGLPDLIFSDFEFSWDFLIKVIEKIESSGCQVIIKNNTLSIMDEENNYYIEGATKKDAVIRGISEYCKIYFEK